MSGAHALVPAHLARIGLHPSMSVQQLGEWCARHRMYVVIDYAYDDFGRVRPTLSARPEPDPEAVPAFLRRQI